MVRRGSITVFTALIMSLVVSLLCSGIESVRMAAARTQILNGLDIGLYSLFGQYDKSLLKDYDLFAVDASGGGAELDMAGIYDSLEHYMKPVLAQNSQRLSIESGGITGYRLLTDEEGEVFYQQTVRYMKETLGSRGVQLLLQKMRQRQKKTEEAETAGSEAENGNALTVYDSEMSEAAEKSQAALEEKRAQEQEQQGEGFTDGGGSNGDISDGGASEEAGFGGTELVPVPVENPIPAIQRIRWMSLLDLVLPPDRSLSDKKVKKGELISGRDLAQGLPMSGEVKKDGSLISQVLYQQYLMDKLGNYRNPGKGGLEYQIEYILGGKASDEENLKSIAKKLLLIREGVNAVCLAADSVRRAQAEALAIAIASGFLIPPAAGIIEGALILCWAFGESILDVRTLFAGGKVPLVKDSSQWRLSLENLPYLLEMADGNGEDSEEGMAYEDYLQVFLLAAKKDNKVWRGMDMLELSMRSAEGWESFRMDTCLAALEASVDVRANKRKSFTVTRQYCYT